MTALIKMQTPEEIVSNMETNAFAGDAVEAFTSWSGPAKGDLFSGASVEAFTSWSGPTRGDRDAGDAVEAFTSWSGPVTA